YLPHGPGIPSAVRTTAGDLRRGARAQNRALPARLRTRPGHPRADVLLLEGHATEDPAVCGAAPPASRAGARRAGIRSGYLDRPRHARGRPGSRDRRLLGLLLVP